MEYINLSIFAGVAIVAWFAVVYFWPLMLLYMYKRSVLARGGGDGPVPINMLYTPPKEVFADPFHAPAGASKFLTTGVNHDTLYTVGWLDLRKGAQILHVPDMHDRYYSIQFTDTSKNINFAYVGKRTTGTQAGEYLITGPGWKGGVPNGMKHIVSPRNSIALFGRTLVKDDSDLPAAYDLAKQIQLTPLGR